MSAGIVMYNVAPFGCFEIVDVPINTKVNYTVIIKITISKYKVCVVHEEPTRFYHRDSS